jgi:hypothetical protein
MKCKKEYKFGFTIDKPCDAVAGTELYKFLLVWAKKHKNKICMYWYFGEEVKKP